MSDSKKFHKVPQHLTMIICLHIMLVTTYKNSISGFLKFLSFCVPYHTPFPYIFLYIEIFLMHIFLYKFFKLIRLLWNWSHSMQNFITNNNCRATSSELLIIFQLLSETKKLAYVIMHKGFAPLCEGGSILIELCVLKLTTKYNEFISQFLVIKMPFASSLTTLSMPKVMKV